MTGFECRLSNPDSSAFANGTQRFFPLKRGSAAEGGEEVAHTTTHHEVDEREYARLLGYPWGTLLDGAVGERAEQAVEWYERHGKPRVYCRTIGTETVTAITAGAEVDSEVDSLWESSRVDEAYFLDRFAAAVVEKLAAGLGPHRSPGTGDLPFEEQFRLFSLLAPLAPELEMLSSGMLRPRNSLLALTPADAPTGSAGNPCTRCNLRGCAFRRTTR